ncbi:hypothetical protein IFM89_007037 [Coptis chinensis]|uniref:UBN2_3 domain-containing protein n=1 Tax=Coptis chinensis TaxID=261450 RepID=A0A835M7N7_9MAGN|nr:hypothetical protein IFM89_007037 [Coptis chinensis]
MEPSVASTVQFLDTAKKIWNAIEEMYSQTSNVSRIYQIFETMFSTKQGDKPLNEHYDLLRILWEELLIYQPITPDVETQCKQREDFQCALFLFSLNSDYVMFKDKILANESFPSAANAYSRLQRASIAYTPFVAKDASTAFVSNGRGGSVRGG